MESSSEVPRGYQQGEVDEQKAFPLNMAATARLKQNDKMKRYVQWALENGAIMDKVNFPAAFGADGDLVGSSALEDIAPNEAFIFVPQHFLLTVERARASVEIGHIFENHDSIFKANTNRDFLTLLLFMIHEMSKGEKSFWHPYFEAVDPGIMPCEWKQSLIDEIDDRQLKEDLKEYAKSMQEDWATVQKLMRIYQEHFDPQVCNETLYKRAAAFISTRCFGWGLPTTIVAPLADSFNHSAKSSAQVDILNKRLHLQKNKIYAYQFDFEQAEGPGEERYDEQSSKLKLNVKRLFKEDKVAEE